MDTLSFVASVIASVAWPITLLCGLLMFRQSIGDLLPNIRRLKYKDIEADFGVELEAVKKISADLSEMKNFPHAHSSGKLQQLYVLASAAPNAAVRKAFREVEYAARQRLVDENALPDMNSATPYHSLQKMLGAKGILDTNGVTVFNELRTLRNKVAHVDEYEVSSEQATEYVEIAWAMVETLKHQQ